MNIKLNADDLILGIGEVNYPGAAPATFTHVYTLVARADTERANQWSLTPNTNVASFVAGSPDYRLYIASLNSICKFQELKFGTGLQALKKSIQPEIDRFYSLVMAQNTKTK